MKKTINVNGTNFTVDVNISAEDRYDSIETDYKKLLYLLGQVSTIGAKLDREFTTRNANLEHWEELINEGIKVEHVSTPAVVKKGLKKLQLTARQKKEAIETIDSTMWWFKALRASLDV